MSWIGHPIQLNCLMNQDTLQNKSNVDSARYRISKVSAVYLHPKVGSIKVEAVNSWSRIAVIELHCKVAEQLSIGKQYRTLQDCLQDSCKKELVKRRIII